MISRDGISRFLGENWFRFNIGWGVVVVVNGIVNYLTFAKVWQGTIEYYGIPFAVAIVALPVTILAGGWVVGYLIIKKNVLAAQNSLQNRQANPEFVALIEQVKRMEETLERVEQQVNRRA